MTITISPCLDEPSYRIFSVNLQGTIITVTVTAKASVVRSWIRDIHYYNGPYLGRLIIGLGVQWTPEGYGDAPADTLQLCLGRRCLVYQLSRSPYVPKMLRRLLECPTNTFVGFWNHSDRRKLEISEHRLYMVRDPLDIREHVLTGNGESLAGASVEEIVQQCLGISGVRMIPEISRSDWNSEYLSADQVLQVTLDAYCAFKIGIYAFG